jgi:hypothetical protein
MRFIIGQWPQTANAGSHRRISITQSCTIFGMNASFVGDATLSAGHLVRALL